MKKIVLLLVMLVFGAVALAQQGQQLLLGNLVAANPQCETQVTQAFLRGANLGPQDQFTCLKLAPGVTMQDAAIAIDLDTAGLITAIDWTASGNSYVSVKTDNTGRVLAFGLIQGYVFVVYSQ